MAKARLKCPECGTYNYITTTFCVSCGEKLEHHPEHTIISDNVPSLPKGEAKKKADFHAPTENKPKKKKPFKTHDFALAKNLFKAFLFSLTIIFIGLIIYPPKITSTEPAGSDLHSFENKAELFMSGNINSVNFTEKEIAAFLHIKALQPTIIQNSEGLEYFVFPSRVQLKISKNGFKLYLCMNIYDVEIIVSIKGELLIKRDGHLYLTLKSIKLGRFPIPKSILKQMLKKMQVSFKYPLPDQIADITLRDGDVFINSRTMRSAKRRIRREKETFNYKKTTSETITDKLPEAEDDFEDELPDEDETEDIIDEEPVKTAIKTQEIHPIKKVSPQTDYEDEEELSVDTLPELEEIDMEEEPAPMAEKEKPQKVQTARRAISTKKTGHKALNADEQEQCKKIKLKGDFLYSRKQYRAALIYYKQVLKKYPGYSEINEVTNKIKDIETNH